MLRVCVALLALLAITACSDSEPDPEAEAAEPSATETPVEVAPYVETHTGPVGLTATEDGAVWVVGAQSETVLRIPAGATEPDLTIDAPGVPLRTTAAFGSVWVTSFHGNVLLRLDPATGEVVASIKTGAGPEGVSAGFDSIWVVAQDAGKLLRIDPETNAVSAEIPLEVGARLVAAGAGRDVRRALRRRRDPPRRPEDQRGHRRPSASATGPQAMVVLDGKIWVTCTLSEELVALDAATLAAASTRWPSRAHPTRSRSPTTGGSWSSPSRGRRW